MISQTTLEAFFYEKTQSQITKRQILVIEYLQKNETASNLGLSRALRLPINIITTCVYLLRKQGIIIFSHSENNPLTHYKNKFWRLKDGFKF